MSGSQPDPKPAPLRSILRDEDAAAYLGISPVTLRQWRSKLRGPRWVRLEGRAIGYKIADLDAYVDARTVDVAD